MPKIPGVNHLQALRALEKAGFSIVRQGKKHIVVSDGTRFLTIPRKNPINAFTMGGIVKDAGLQRIGFVSCCKRQWLSEYLCVREKETKAAAEVFKQISSSPIDKLPPSLELRRDRPVVVHSTDSAGSPQASPNGTL